MNNNSCWIYCAVSSEEQAKNLADDQLAWAKSTAAQHGWTVTRIFGADSESGVGSGALSIRKILRTLLDELTTTVKKERPTRIILSRVDRLGREALDVIAAIAKIRSFGVMLHTRQDGDLRIEKASDVILPALRAITGALENEARSDKWKAVHARRRAAGLHIGFVPFGIVLIDGRATAYEPEAMLVRDLFERAAKGWGYARLAKWMQTVAPLKRLSDGTTRKVSWAPSSVKSILTAKSIREVVVSDELWQRAKAARALDFRARAPKRWPWPLQGAVRCTCGKMLSGMVSGPTDNRTRYYVCRYHTLEPGRKSHPSHRADELEAAFVAVLRRLRSMPNLFLEAEHRNVDSLRQAERDLKGVVADAERRRQVVWRLAEEGNMPGSMVRERIDEIDAERERARAELERVQAAINEAASIARATSSVTEMLAVLEDTWEHADTAQRQEIARAVSELPVVAGLYADPERRNELLVGSDAASDPTRRDAAKVRLSDARRMIAASTSLVRITTGFP